jgi:hypothetical protein
MIDILLLVICFIASGFLSIYLGQDRNWDLRNYHFYNAYAFLNDRLTYDIAPAQIQSFYNPLLDIPYYWMMTHLLPVIYGFLVGGLQGINIWLIYKIAYCTLVYVSETKRRLLSIAAGITGYYGAANMSEIGTTFHDNITSLFVLGSLLLIVSSIQKRGNLQLYVSKKSVITAGILLGLATGLKLTTAIYSIPFVLAFLFIEIPWIERIRNFLISSLSIGLGFFISAGYWMTTLWKIFQNPLFPYYNKIFKSPYYEFINFSDHRFLPRDKYQILFYPFHFLKNSTLVSDGSFRDIRFTLCYMLLMLFLFMFYYKKVTLKYGHQELTGNFEFSGSLKNMFIFIIVFFVSSYIFWQYMFSIYRYIIPLELLSPVFILLIIRYIFPFEKILTRLSLAIFALIIVTVSPINWGRVAWADSYFDVRIPPLENIDRSIVIMADDEPLSYIIPFFPKSTRFISVQNNFTNPASKTLLQDKIRKILQESGGNLYLLYKEKSRNDYDGILKFYNLKITKQNFKRLYTRFDDDLFLFPVAHIQVR